MSSPDLPPSDGRRAEWRLPEIHPEGRKYVLIAGVAALVAFFVWDFVTWPLIGLAIWVAAFFRDPVRVTPQDEGLVIAPADGLVTAIDRVLPPPEMRRADALGEAPMVRVSILISLFDVHVNRTPIAGTVRDVIYISGKRLNVDLDKASEENERQHVIVESRDGLKIGFTQIAGIISRRIVSFVKPGDMVARGQRVGIIHFGSRVDVYLPDAAVCQIIVGQRAIAGETVIARLGGSLPAPGIAH